jgi:hypothetical protein
MPDISNPLDDDTMDQIKDKATEMAKDQLQGGGSDEDHEQDQPPEEQAQETAEQVEERYSQD